MKRTIFGFYLGLVGLSLFIFTLAYGMMNTLNDSIVSGLIDSGMIGLTLISIMIAVAGIMIMVSEIKKD